MLKVTSIVGTMRKASLIAALPLLLNACADDITGPVNAYVAKGPITGSECRLFRADNNTQLAAAGETVEGFVDFGNVAFSGVGYVECTGGSYKDEATAGTVDATGLILRSAKRFAGGTTFIVTPVTEIAVRKAAAASGGIEANAENFNNSVADNFGLSALDITSVQPTDLSTTPAQNNPEGWYGTVLAGISQLDMTNTDEDISGVVDILEDSPDLSSGGFTEALDDLGDNANVNGNENSGVTDAVQDGLGSNPDGSPGLPITSPVLEIRSIVPSVGPETGSTEVIIIGANFVAGDSLNVTVDGQAATGVTVDSPTQITATTPSGTAGAAVDVVVTNGDGQVITAAGAFTYVALDSVVTVVGVNPPAGPEAGGTQLTISGANFVAGDSLGVLVGGNLASVVAEDNFASNVTWVSPTQITATTPPGTAGDVDVVVVNGDGQIAIAEDAFTYVTGDAPTITSVSPLAGTETGGTQLTITGTNFVAGKHLSVTVDGQAATGVTVDSATQIITATTPSGTAGSVVDVVVINGDGQGVTAGSAFTYKAEGTQPTIDGITPSRGPEAGGTVLAIVGENFESGDYLKVTVDGQAATGVTVDSATQITATTPSGTAGAAVDMVVTNGDGQVVLVADAFTYTDGSGPLIDSVSPATGSEAGGTQLTITGANYATGGSLSVTVDGQAATGVTVDSATQITAITPSGTAGSAVDVVVVNGDGQDVTATDVFTYQGACQHCELDANGCPF